MIKASVADCTKLEGLSLGALALWPLALAQADTFGRLTADPRRLKRLACPYVKAITIRVIERALVDLSAVKLIHLYADGATQLLVFHDHQHHSPSRNLRFRKSKYPAPAADICHKTPSCVELDSTPYPVPLTPLPSPRTPTVVPTTVPTTVERPLPENGLKDHVEPVGTLSPHDPDSPRMWLITQLVLDERGRVPGPPAIYSMIQEAHNLAGVPLDAIEAAARDPNRKGQKFWEDLDALRKNAAKKTPGRRGRSFDLDAVNKISRAFQGRKGDSDAIEKR